MNIKKIISLEILIGISSVLVSLIGGSNSYKFQTVYTFILINLSIGVTFFVMKNCLNNCDKSQDICEEAKRSTEKLDNIKDVILEISHGIVEINNYDELYNYILEKAIYIIKNADKGTLLVKNDENYLEVKAAIGYNCETMKEIKLSMDESFFRIRDYTQSRKSVIKKNLSEFNKEHMNEKNYKLLEASGGFNIKTTLSCPVIINNEFYGILNIDSHIENAFTEEDIFLIEYFTNEIQNAIKSYQLFDEKIYLSRHDSLTGLYNRHYLNELLTKFLNTPHKYRKEFNIVVFDLNRLKAINDKYGHVIGDEALKIFSRKLETITSDDDLLARYGGDEFVGVFFNKDPKEVEGEIENLLDELRSLPVQIDSDEIRLSASYGISSYPEEFSSFTQLLKLADKRMYINKKENRVK